VVGSSSRRKTETTTRGHSSPPLYFICDNAGFFFLERKVKEMRTYLALTRLRGLYLVASKINENDEEGTFLVVAVVLHLWGWLVMGNNTPPSHVLSEGGMTMARVER
jgi:hypothetical protein